MALSNQSYEVIGVIPAAGQARRLSPLPCSKELFPIGFRYDPGNQERRPKVVCHYLLEKMRQAGVTKAYVILRQGKWDIPMYLGDGKILDMHLGYLMMDLPYGSPYTLDQAYPFVKDAVVAFGFPDILFDAGDAFVKLMNCQATSDADIILGLFPADRPHNVDMVDIDDNGRIQEIIIKPRQTQFCYTWDIAVWTPVFTRFLHEHLISCRPSASMTPELSVGNIIRAAIRKGLRVEGVKVSNEPYLDIGTPEDLMRALGYYFAQ